MTDRDMLKVVAEAAVALDDAKHRIQELEAEVIELLQANDELNDDLDDYKYIHQVAQDDLKDAERRIQFLEKML
jgi:chromosome segregation ATPase